MKRVSVTIPDELAREVRRRLPGVNVSGLLQEALRAALECEHDQLVCSTCSAPVSSVSAAERLLEALYVDVIRAIEDLLCSGGTVEGVARVVKRVGERHRVRVAFERPLPRRTRAEREEAKHRHPAAGVTASEEVRREPAVA